MTTPVDLKPSPGFCIKSTALQPAVYTPAPPTPHPPPSRLEPYDHAIVVPKGMKVFVNIAWDPNVPPPPQGSEDAIQQAMKGADVDESNPDGWYVPVVVSEARQEKDKAGHPSLVFDCVYNSSLKSRTLRDQEFKIFLVELALQRIEAQTPLVLSRQIGTPNIAAKGKLEPRRVWVPTLLLEGKAPGDKTNEKGKGKPLIQEVNQEGAERKGILKNKDAGKGKEAEGKEGAPLEWSWRKRDDGRLEVRVLVPGLTAAILENTTLDVEPRRLILTVPHRPVLDINLALSDAEIVATVNTTRGKETQGTLYPQMPVEGDVQEETQRLLTLKRQRDLDVESARAEGRIGEGVVLVDC